MIAKHMFGMGRRFTGSSSQQYYLTFNGTTTVVACGSDASLDDIPLGDFTAEAWVLPLAAIDSYPFTIGKGWINSDGWALMWREQREQPAMAMEFTTSRIITDGYGTAYLPEAWIHVAMVWNSTSAIAKLYEGGVLKRTSNAQTGTYVSDAARNLHIGQDSQYGRSFAGYIAWVRISNNQRYTADFTPDAKDAPPAVDGNTNDGSGTTARAEVNSNNDGAITDGSWVAL
jgi:hypothetical protein